MASEVLKKALMASAAEEYFNIKLISEADEWELSDSFTAKMDALVRKTDAPARRGFRYTLLIAAVICLISVTAVFSFADVRNEVIRLFRESTRVSSQSGRRIFKGIPGNPAPVPMSATEIFSGISRW